MEQANDNPVVAAERDGLIVEAESVAKVLRRLAGEVVLLAQSCEMLGDRIAGCTTMADLASVAERLAPVCAGARAACGAMRILSTVGIDAGER
jgi:hypothetical protein